MNESDVIDGWVQACAATRVSLTQGVLLVGPDSTTFEGYAGSARVRVGRGCNLDLNTRYTADLCLVLPGAVEEYRVSVVADVVCLTHLTHGAMLRLHPGCGVSELHFFDGVVALQGCLYRGVRVASAPSGAQAQEIRFAKLVADGATQSVGAMQSSLPSGVLMEVLSRAGCDTVYGADAVAPIVLDGCFTDFDCRLDGRVISLEAHTLGRRDVVYVLGGGGLVFNDGRSSAETLRGYLRGGPQTAGQSRRAHPLHVTAVALSLSPMGARPQAVAPAVGDSDADEYFAGQLVEADVSFKRPLLVIGVPRIELRFGEITRHARYVAGSGSDTLRFTYEVTKEDVEVLERTSSCVQGAAGFHVNDIEVGPVVTDRAVLLEVNADGDLGGASEDDAGGKAHFHVMDQCELRVSDVGLDIDLYKVETSAAWVSPRAAGSSTAAKLGLASRGAVMRSRRSALVFPPSGFGAPLSLTGF